MKVLVVDDKPTNRKLLTKTLEKWGHQVSEAGDGQQAIDHCRNEIPDLILMDIMMPGINGMDAAEQIRDLPGGPDVSIIFVTAVQEAQGLVGALEAGGDDYVTKPVDMSVLAAKITAQQRTRELSRQLAEQNERLQRRNRELKHEHHIVDHFFSRIQANNFVPQDMLRYHASSATAFSGDLLLSAARPSGGIYLLVGDFTGHGLSAAMGSLPVAELFAELTADGLPIGLIARRINHFLVSYLPPEIFLAATLAELDASGTLLQYWTGGLPNGILLCPDGSIMSVTSQHMPLGILSDTEFDESVSTRRVMPGARLLLMTDGITEAASHDHECFGEARVEQTLQGLNQHTDALAKLQRTVMDFVDTGRIDDDVVVAELTCRPLPATQTADHLSDHGRNYPTRFDIQAGAEDIIRGGISERAVDLLCVLPAARRYRGELHTVMSELVSNTIDHGLLRIAPGERQQTADFATLRAERIRQLEDARLSISVAVAAGEQGWHADIKVCHGGPGQPVTSAAHGGDNDQDGRGLMILEALCEEVRLAPDGRCTSVRYTLQ